MGKFKDLTGKKFGKLTVVSRAEDYISSNGRHRTMWNCKCDCGNDKVVGSDALLAGHQVSCGCYRAEKLSQMTKKHGMTDTRLYYVWSGIKNRCYNENVLEYMHYGARGIYVCDEWKEDFMCFYNWAIEHGYNEDAPRGECTVDRINTDGPYSPDNCRIVTQLQQMQNVRTNHNITYGNETHSIAEWSRITGIRPEKIRNRVSRLGWSPERALTTI